MNIKNLTPLFLYHDIFHLCIHDILRIYNILTTPVNSSSAYGCWPVGLAPVWLQETCNNPDDVRWSTRFRNFLISVMMMIMIIIITNLTCISYFKTHQQDRRNEYISKLNIIIICNSSIFIYWFIYYCILISPSTYTIDLNTITIYDLWFR